MFELACPLCDSIALQPVPDEENYYFCNKCYLIFLHPSLRKDPETEKSRYLHHRNSINDQGYINFLNKIIEPAISLLHSSMAGLDYGCGPSPVLAELLKKHNINCENYDPFFFPIDLKDNYHFIFSTECFEHFHNPAKEINFLTSVLRTGGYLMIMTEWWKNLESFKSWHYKRDFTHVCFYHLSTFEYFAKYFGYDLIYNDQERVIILKKL